MTAPTHVAFGVMFAAFFGVDTILAVSCALGSLLPDIDHPQSSIGRVFYFLSIPISLRYGHRAFVHSLTLWLPLMIVGYFFKSDLLYWLGVGAVSHCWLDTLNISGVKLLVPLSEQDCVFLPKRFRIKTASLNEIYVFLIFTGIVFTLNYAHAIGGPRKLINEMLLSNKITVEEYIRAGNQICYADGQWRWADGRLQDVKWLVVGTDSNSSDLVLFDGNRLIKKNKGEFVRSKLVETKREWNMVKVSRFVECRKDLFYYDGKVWHFAVKGSLAVGSLKSLELITIDSAL
jgi:membrane-bound metal-dependent hydrolase YbcI (DUF457 family)